MLKLLLLVLSLISNSAFAENWQKLGEQKIDPFAESQEFAGKKIVLLETYIDKESISIKGNKIVAVTLDNTTGVKGYMTGEKSIQSSVSVEEFDCAKRSFRILRFAIYPQLFARGGPVNESVTGSISDSSGVENYPVPGQSEYLAMTFLCKR